jgi:cell division protein FtsQ
MTGPDLPDQPVPDTVLEELLAAFGTNDANADVGSADPSVSYDFDDPSIDRLLGVETAATDVLQPPAQEDAAPEKRTIDLTAVEEVGGTDRPPTPTGSTRRDAKAAARADAQAVKAATKEANKAAKASSKATAKESKRAAREAAKAAKRGEPPKPTVAPIDPLTPKPVDVPAARQRVPVGAAAGGSARRTIVIADDDQPGDTLYLDEDAEQRLREIHAAPSAAAARSTIVIDGTDHALDTVPTQAASPNIDPRLRARRLAVHHAASRRRLLWVGIAIGVVLVVVGVIATLASPLFDARDIEVQGNQYTDPALIQHVRQEMQGKPILLVDTTKLERELQASPWVESARVSTDFPHHVLVDIRERKPVATFAGSDGNFRVIDRDGQVLAVLAGRPIDYVLLTGAAPDSEAGQFAGAAYAAAAQLVIALPPEIKAITSSIGVDATTNELTLELDAPDAAGVHVRLGTVSGIEDKLARLVVFVRDGLEPGQQLDVATAEVGS